MLSLPVSVASLALFSTAALAAERTLTVKNNCDYTIWPAIFTSAGTRPSHPTGWEMAAGSTEVVSNVADNWNGRIWGRTGCDFSENSKLPTTCATGGCNGGLLCDASTGTGKSFIPSGSNRTQAYVDLIPGVPPVTLAEFHFAGGVDWYDLSAVDGTNVPMGLRNNAGCNEPVCKVDINDSCPGPLQAKNKEGEVVGCYTACSANLDGNQANSGNCCSGDHDKPATCPSSGVAYYSDMKSLCPAYYWYAYDDDSALKTCDGKLNANYVIEFCPK